MRQVDREPVLGGKLRDFPDHDPDHDTAVQQVFYALNDNLRARGLEIQGTE